MPLSEGSLETDGDKVMSSPVVEGKKTEQQKWEAGPVVVLSGYLEKLDEQGKWRLYRTARLEEYIEFDESAILYIANETRTNQEKAEKPPRHEPVYIWFNSAIELRFETKFLAGELADMYMPQSSMPVSSLGTGGLLQLITRAAGTDIPGCRV